MTLPPSLRTEEADMWRRAAEAAERVTEDPVGVTVPFGPGRVSRTYEVEWARASDPGLLLVCAGLTPRDAFARLLNACKGDHIIIRRITREREQ